MREWWLSLEARERGLVILMVTMITATLAYHLIWRGLGQELQRQQQRQSTLQADLQWMRQAASEVGQLTDDQKPPGTQTQANISLIALIERAAHATETKAAIRRMSPDGDNVARIHLNPVVFNQLLDLIAWLQRQGIKVEELTLKSHATTGQVSGNLALHRR